MLIVDITVNGLGHRLCPVTLKIERSEEGGKDKRLEKTFACMLEMSS